MEGSGGSLSRGEGWELALSWQKLLREMLVSAWRLQKVQERACRGSLLNEA